MSANLQHCASKTGEPATNLKRSLLPHRIASARGKHGPSGNRFERELIWVLISLLILLYLAASYVYWAKTRGAWPV